VHKISYTGRLLPPEPLAWPPGQLFAPNQKLPQSQKTGKEQNISMRRIFVIFTFHNTVLHFLL